MKRLLLVLAMAIVLIQIPTTVNGTELNECIHYIDEVRDIGRQAKKLSLLIEGNNRKSRMTKSRAYRDRLRRESNELKDEIEDLLSQMSDLKEQYVECCKEYRRREGHRPGESRAAREARISLEKLMRSLR